MWDYPNFDRTWPKADGLDPGALSILAMRKDSAYRKIFQVGGVQDASTLRFSSIACLCKTIGIGRQIAGYMMQACSRRHMYGSSSGALDAREKAVSFAG